MIDHPSTFARHFARLVSLLARAPADVDGQKGALRAAALAAREGGVELARTNGRLTVNGAPLATAIPDVSELAARLDAHAVRALRVDTAAPPADLLGAARHLAASPVGRFDATGAVQLVVDSPPPDGAHASATNGAAPAPAGAEARPPSDEAAAALLERLGSAETEARAAELVGELAERAALATRAGDVAAVTALLRDALDRVPAALDTADPGLAAALERLTGPDQLALVAEGAARRRADRGSCDAVLARVPRAAEVLARLLAAAEDPAERAAHRDALVRLRIGAAQLTHLLDHHDWAVVVSAAEGLAEVGDARSHDALAKALAHSNANVRRAAARALGALRATTGAPALRTALRDGSSAVRGEAANALVLLGGSGVGTALADALADERHPDAQLELLAALGRLATAEAVQYLVQAAAPAGRLFGRKPAPFRCAAVAALGVARTPGALAALRELTNDREREVREAVFLAAVGAGGGARPRGQEN